MNERLYDAQEAPLKHHPSFATTCLALWSTALMANPGSDPARVVTGKADDYGGRRNNQQQKWTGFVNASRNLGIKGSGGAIPSRFAAGHAATGDLGEPGESPPPRHYDVYLVAGQSNTDGRGTNAHLTGDLAPYAAPQPDVRIFYVNPTNRDPINPRYNTGWRMLAPGYAAPRTSRTLPTHRFGFEVSLGRALAAQDPERNVALIKVSQGGTSLQTHWNPAGDDGNFMWQTFANKVPEALAALTANGDTAEIRGIFWHQGESDGGNPTYQADLVAFIAAVRALTGKPELPFAIGELERDDVTPPVRDRTYQLTAMANVAAADPHTILVSSAGLLTYDGTHFTSEAYIVFGERFAQAFHDFEQGLNYTVVYDGNGATGGDVPVDETAYNSGATATVRGADDLARDGHGFAGWNTQPDGSGAAYADGSVFVITENTTLYAQWEE